MKPTQTKRDCIFLWITSNGSEDYFDSTLYCPFFSHKCLHIIKVFLQTKSSFLYWKLKLYMGSLQTDILRFELHHSQVIRGLSNQLSRTKKRKGLMIFSHKVEIIQFSWNRTGCDYFYLSIVIDKNVIWMHIADFFLNSLEFVSCSYHVVK